MERLTCYTYINDILCQAWDKALHHSDHTTSHVPQSSKKSSSTVQETFFSPVHAIWHKQRKKMHIQYFTSLSCMRQLGQDQDSDIQKLISKLCPIIWKFQIIEVSVSTRMNGQTCFFLQRTTTSKPQNKTKYKPTNFCKIILWNNHH